MLYINLKNQEVIDVNQLYALFPNVSFAVAGPDLTAMADLDVARVMDVAMPTITVTQLASQAGAEYVNGQWQTLWAVRSKTDDELAADSQAKADALAVKRYTVENGGMTVNGLPIRTDEFTRVNLIGARILAAENPKYTVQWKTGGTFVTLDAATIIAVSDAVAAHIQKCFDTENTVLGQIDSYDTPAAVVQAFMTTFTGA